MRAVGLRVRFGDTRPSTLLKRRRMSAKLEREEWVEVMALLDQALDMPASERELWLVSVPTTKPSIKPALQRLLAQQQRSATEDFLNKGVELDVCTNADAGDTAGVADGQDP
jgi:hypothetical protein